MKLLGSIVYITSAFYRFVLGSLLSTLDSLLFCIFIIQPDQRKCKMGCSTKERGKVWRKSGFTDALRCGMIFMLGLPHFNVKQSLLYLRTAVVAAPNCA